MLYLYGNSAVALMPRPKHWIYLNAADIGFSPCRFSDACNRCFRNSTPPITGRVRYRLFDLVSILYTLNIVMSIAIITIFRVSFLFNITMFRVYLIKKIRHTTIYASYYKWIFIFCIFFQMYLNNLLYLLHILKYLPVDSSKAYIIYPLLSCLLIRHLNHCF